MLNSHVVVTQIAGRPWDRRALPGELGPPAEALGHVVLISSMLFNRKQKAVLFAVKRALPRNLGFGIDARCERELPARGVVNQIVKVQHSGRFSPQKSVAPGAAHHLIMDV